MDDGMSGTGRCRRARTRPASTRRSGDRPPVFDTSFGIRELVALTDEDLRQLDDLAGDAEGHSWWWSLRRLEWAEEEAHGR